MTKAQLRWRMIIDAFGVIAFVPFIVLGLCWPRFDVWLAGMAGFGMFGICWWIDYGDRWWRVMRGRYP